MLVIDPQLDLFAAFALDISRRIHGLRFHAEFSGRLWRRATLGGAARARPGLRVTARASGTIGATAACASGTATTGHLSGTATTGHLSGTATTGHLSGTATTGHLSGIATTGHLSGIASTGHLSGIATGAFD